MNFSRVPLYFGSLEYMSKKIFKNNQWLALGLIIFGGLVGFFPFNAQANVSASMINALPQKTSQVFPLQIPRSPRAAAADPAGVAAHVRGAGPGSGVVWCPGGQVS